MPLFEDPSLGNLVFFPKGWARPSRTTGGRSSCGYWVTCDDLVGATSEARAGSSRSFGLYMYHRRAAHCEAIPIIT